jgi:hypothetical protein
MRTDLLLDPDGKKIATKLLRDKTLDHLMQAFLTTFANDERVRR